jgi:hypothetical protein
VPDESSTVPRETDLEANGDGLLWVDLLSLPRTFSWRRYRVDLIGLLATAALVVLIILLVAVAARVL